jgi:peptidyl-prolyl cis-trans isomerase D
MISLMRRYRRLLQVSLLVVIAAFVITSVVVSGANPFKGGGAGARDGVATVNGETIPTDRYQRRYQAYLETYAQIYRDRFSPELAERMGLPQQVMNDLVLEAIVVQRARAEGLEITDAELNAQIQAVPAFQEAGRFTLRRYQEFLKRRGMNATAFESEVRRELTRMKAETTVRSGVKVAPPEVEQAWQSRNEGLRAAWALIEVAPLAAGVTVSDSDLDTYLKSHEAEYRQPERRKVTYVTVPTRDFIKAPTDAEIEKYYSEHASEFEKPPQIRVAHVLVRVPETGGSEGEDKARARIAEVITRAKGGEDFGKIARELSEDPGSKPNGGDLGLVRKGEMVPQFEQAAFAMKAGEISPEPVRTPFGFHAIKVSEVNPGAKTPLKEVAAQIRDRISATDAERAAKAKADEVRGKLGTATDFSAEARRLGLTPTDVTIPKTEEVGAGGVDTMARASFELTVEGLSQPVKTPAGFVVIKSREALPPAVPPLAEIKDRVSAALKRERAEGIARERAKQLVAEAKSGDFGAAAKKAGATIGETPRFSLAKPAEKVPGDAMLAAFQTIAGATSEPVTTPQGYYVMKVLERVPADPGGFAAEKEKVTREVLTQKQGQAWQAWIERARAGAKVETAPPPKVFPRRG